MPIFRLKLSATGRTSSSKAHEKSSDFSGQKRRADCSTLHNNNIKLQKLVKLPVYIPSAIHDAHDVDHLFLMVRYVEYQVIVHWHNMKVAAAPWFISVYPKPLRHLIQECNVLFQTVKLPCSILDRLQVNCNIFKNAAKVIFRLCCQSHFIIHTLYSLRISVNTSEAGRVRPAWISAYPFSSSVFNCSGVMRLTSRG